MLITIYHAEWFVGPGAARAQIDPTRMAQGIMTGIGFLGAGVIFKEGLSVRGLTTAASIWVTAAVGILIGVKEHPGITLFYHLIAIPGLALFIAGWVRMSGHPIAFMALLAPYIPLSINWGQATGVWLVAHTSREYEWPQAVCQAIGEPVRKGAGW